MITNNAGNHATIFGYYLKIPCVRFGGHLMMQPVHSSCQKNKFAFKIGPQCLHILVVVTLDTVLPPMGFRKGLSQIWSESR